MRRRRRAVTRSYQTELTAHQFLDGVAEFWTYTHAHRAPGLGAPTRYLPPGFVEPLFEEAPADAGPVKALVFPHTGQTRNACKRPAGGRWPVRHAFDAGHPDDWRKWATRPDTVFINQHKRGAPASDRAPRNRRFPRRQRVPPGTARTRGRRSRRFGCRRC